MVLKSTKSLDLVPLQIYPISRAGLQPSVQLNLISCYSRDDSVIYGVFIIIAYCLFIAMSADENSNDDTSTHTLDDIGNAEIPERATQVCSQ